MTCPECGAEMVEVDPLDENLDLLDIQIREFECLECGEVAVEDLGDDEEEEGDD